MSKLTKWQGGQAGIPGVYCFRAECFLPLYKSQANDCVLSAYSAALSPAEDPLFINLEQLPSLLESWFLLLKEDKETPFIGLRICLSEERGRKPGA